jgi:glycosyltransferase involved in cell wall biosynthesis
MDIIIDIRALMGGKVSGVEVYITRLLTHLFEKDKTNRYLLFCNAYAADISDPEYSNNRNVKILRTKIPNKILNISLSLLNFPKLDKYIGNKQKYFLNFKPEVFLMPDLRPVALSKNIRTIQVIHDLSFKHFPAFYSIKTRLYHHLLRVKKQITKADKIIAVSRFTKEDIIKTYKPDQEKIEVIYEGVDENFGSGRGQNKVDLLTKYNIPEDYFLFLATLEPRRNLKRLLEAFAEFKNSTTNHIKLVLAGIKNEQIFNSTRLKLSKDVILTGFIAEVDKAELFKNARAFIYPSLYEGFGLPLLEAMKCGTPIITSNKSSMPEIVGDSALTVNPYDSRSIEKAMHKILDQRVVAGLKSKMNCQIKKFSWNKCAEQTLKIIESLGKS